MISSLKYLRYILKFTSKVRITVLILLMVLGAVLETVGVGLFLPLFGGLTSPEKYLDKIPDFLKYYFSNSQSTAISIENTFIFICVVFIFKNIMVIIVQYAQSNLLNTSSAGIQGHLVRRYLDQEYSFHLVRNSNTLIRNVTHSVPEAFGAITHVSHILLETLQATGIVVLLFLVNPQVTAIVLAVIGVGAASVYLSTKKLNISIGSEQQSLVEKILRSVRQNFAAIKEISLMGFHARFGDEIVRQLDRRARLNTYRDTLHFIPRAVLEILFMLTVVIASVIALRSGFTTDELIPLLGLYAIAAVRLLPSANRIIHHSSGINYSSAAIETVHDDLKLPIAPATDRELREPVNEKPFFESRITLHDVRFRYPEAVGQALNGVSFEIKKGQTIGLVGPSGAGKSTIVEILLAILKPDDGQILVDGHSIHANVRDWQDHIGYVPQNIFLFDDTVTANVAFGQTRDEVDISRVRQSISLAKLDAVVDGLSEGLETVLGEDGVRLSGGQRQRVGIARALYRDPDLLVFDEATSALDNESENAITQAIHSLHGKKTIIIIAHRLSTVRNCDALVYVRDGRIIDQGTFDDLTDRNPEFKNLVELSDLGNSGDREANRAELV